MLRAIFLAAGDAERFGGGDKHLIVLEGERLLDRLTRQAREHGCDDVLVLGREGYEVPGARLIVPVRGPTKFDDSHEHWAADTVIVHGDVWLSDEAADKIFQRVPDWTLYARPDASVYSGCYYSETFALGFNEVVHRLIWSAISLVGELPDLPRRGTWEVYSVLCGYSAVDNPNQDRGHFVHINDWTEDFDWLEDVEEWVRRREVVKRNTSTVGRR